MSIHSDGSLYPAQEIAKMHHWHISEFLGNIEGGDIIILANSVAEARQIAKDSFLDYIKIEKDYLFLYDDEDSLQQVNNYIQQFSLEITEEPIITLQSIFIRGNM